MDLEFSPEQDALRSTVRDLFQRQFDRDYVRECDRTKTAPSAAFKQAGDLGWLGITIPEEHGGAGGSTVDLAVLLEELGRGFLDLALWVFRAVTYGGRAVSVYGTPEQKERFLPGIATGDLSFCFSLTEPESGSDAAALRTRATRTATGYRVSGQKMFTSGFKVSQYVFVAVRTSDDKHAGISNLLVPTDSPGLTATPLETLGNWPVGTTLLHFDEVEVPAENLLGEEGGGWPMLTRLLEYERLCLSAARAGAAQSALADALDYAQQRHQFGRPIGKFQAVSHKLADMQLMCDIARMMVYRYAYRLDKGRATVRDAAELKLYVAEVYKQVSDLGLQVMGGYGYMMEFDMQRHFRESRLATIGGGTSEIQRNIIAKTMGL